MQSENGMKVVGQQFKAWTHGNLVSHEFMKKETAIWCFMSKKKVANDGSEKYLYTCTLTPQPTPLLFRYTADLLQ